MNLFESWWPTGEQALVFTHNGQIADDKPIQDSIIFNDAGYQHLKTCIALNVIHYNLDKLEGKKRVKKDIKFQFMPNNDDLILENKFEVDFNSEVIVVVIGAQIEDILYSSIFDCYLVRVSKECFDKKYYSAGICKKFNSDFNKKYKLSFFNKKPEFLNYHRPENNNDEY